MLSRSVVVSGIRNHLFRARILPSHPLQCNSVRKTSSQHRVILLPEVPSDTGANNPILKPFDQGLPDLTSVTERHCYFGLGKALLEFEAAVAFMESQCEEGERNFDALFEPLEKAKSSLMNSWTAVQVLHVTTDALNRDRFIQLHRRAERAYLTRIGSRVIYETLHDIKKEHEEKNHLNANQLAVLDRYLLEYKHQGFELSEVKQKELTGNWIKKLMEARRDYNFKITKSTQRFSSTIKDPTIVRDFPIDLLRAMAIDSSQPTRGPWTVSLHPYIYRKFMEYCPDRKMRWNIFHADVTRGSAKQDVYLGVVSQIKDLRQHRLDQAVTLGYHSFAEMAMETKMATKLENVHTMIASLLGKAKEGQERELDELQKYAEDRGFEENLNWFDLAFFERKQRRTFLGMTDDELRDYFPLPKVITEVFRLCENSFDIHFEEVKDGLQVWHPEVKLFRVVDHDMKELGMFYLDPYIRDDKAYSGGDRGWYMPMRTFSSKANCGSLGAMIMSLPLPAFGKPALLSFQEVQEILRLTGNMLIHILSTNEWSDLSGKTGIEWDALDVASNFMSHWLSSPTFLKSLSGHWSSNEPLPEDVILQLSQIRHHMAGFKLCNELYKSAYDISFYSDEYDNEGFEEIAERLHSQYFLLPRDKDDTFPTHFSEILGGDYPSAYYSATWAKMLAADAFSAVQEAGQNNEEEVKKVTKRFRKTFLSLGSSLPAAEVFRQFRGRNPSHEALLLSLGLKELQKPKKKGAERK